MEVAAPEQEDLRPGGEFRFTVKPTNMAASTFMAVTTGGVTITRRFSNLQKFAEDTPVIAHWHGDRRTDAFLSTVGDLKAKLKEQGF